MIRPLVETTCTSEPFTPVQSNFAAQRIDLDVPVLDVVQIHRAVHRLHMHVSVGYVTNIHGRSRTFQIYIAMQFLRVQRPGAGMQGDAGIGRNQNFIVHAPGFGVGAGQQVRLNIHPVSALVVIHLDLIGVQNRIHDVQYCSEEGLTEIDP